MSKDTTGLLTQADVPYPSEYEWEEIDGTLYAVGPAGSETEEPAEETEPETEAKEEPPKEPKPRRSPRKKTE